MWMSEFLNTNVQLHFSFLDISAWSSLTWRIQWIRASTWEYRIGSCYYYARTNRIAFQFFPLWQIQAILKENMRRLGKNILSRNIVRNRLNRNIDRCIIIIVGYCWQSSRGHVESLSIKALTAVLHNLRTEAWRTQSLSRFKIKNFTWSV